MPEAAITEGLVLLDRDSCGRKTGIAETKVMKQQLTSSFCGTPSTSMLLWNSLPVKTMISRRTMSHGFPRSSSSTSIYRGATPSRFRTPWCGASFDPFAMRLTLWRMLPDVWTRDLQNSGDLNRVFRSTDPRHPRLNANEAPRDGRAAPIPAVNVSDWVTLHASATPVASLV